MTDARVGLLRRARVLLSFPRNWTQRTFATNSDGGEVSINSPTACRFCMLGAVMLAAREAHDMNAYWSTNQALGYTIWGDPVAWNDNPKRQHKEVLDALDATIERLEKPCNS